MLPRIAWGMLLFCPWSLCAQTPPVKAEIKGHFIGEGVAELLGKEPEVRQQVSTCERSPRKSDCDEMLAAVKSGNRATVSISSWMSFVLDAGRLVKLQTLIPGEFGEINADLTRKFGLRSAETVFPMRNAIGQNWEDRLCVWDTPAVFVGLHEDNNPASQNHHFVLVLESRAEHERDRERSNEAKKSSAMNE